MADLDLANPDTIRTLLPTLPYMEVLEPEYAGLRAIKMDLMEIVVEAELSPMEAALLGEKIFKGRTYEETKKIFFIGGRWQKTIIEKAINRIARS